MFLHMLTCMALSVLTGYIAAITIFRGLFGPLPAPAKVTEAN